MLGSLNVEFLVMECGREHSSINGCVTTLSIDIGKFLDVAVLSKMCQCIWCQRHEDSDDPKENLVC